MIKNRYIKSEINNKAPYPCMQPRVTSNDRLSDDDFSLKLFAFKIILGIIGGVWMLSISSSYQVIDSVAVTEPLKIWPLVISIILLIVGISGIVDLIKKILGS